MKRVASTSEHILPVEKQSDALWHENPDSGNPRQSSATKDAGGRGGVCPLYAMRRQAGS